MECEICHKGPKDGVSLYRQNEKGALGIWRCLKHNKAYIDPEVKEIVKVIEDK